MLGVLPGIIGTLQATEAIKLLTGIGEPLVGKLLLYDALRTRFRQITLPRDPGCPVCGDAPSITTLTEMDLTCAPGALDAKEEEMTVEELRQWRNEHHPHLLIDVTGQFRDVSLIE